MEYKEYEKSAEKILCYHKQPITDENIGIVINYIMTADHRFNGIGTMHGFRKLYLDYAIKTIIQNAQKQKRFIFLENYDKFQNKLKYKDPDPFFWENFKSLLTNIEYDAILLRYKNNMTFDEIGLTFNKSHEWARTIINKALGKIKNNVS